jgi:hypothetical protein
MLVSIVLNFGVERIQASGDNSAIVIKYNVGRE